MEMESMQPYVFGMLMLLGVVVACVVLLSCCYCFGPWLHFSAHNTLAEKAARMREKRTKRMAEHKKRLGTAKPIGKLFDRDATATGLVEAIKEGRVTSEAALQSFMAHSVACHDDLNCVTEDVWEEAIAAAKKADSRVAQPGKHAKQGVLHGLPMSIKDSYDQAGTDSTCGMMARCESPRLHDGLLVELLRDAGAIPFVRTNVPQLMLLAESTNAIYGASNNPWDTARTVGGSTGGEAGLIAARGSPLGVGTDIAGSIRIPAHFCGICGIKTSSSRVTKHGLRDPLAEDLMPESTVAMVGVGPLGHCVEDLALVLKAWMVPKMWAKDITVPPIPFREEIFRDRKRKLRIGLWESDSYCPAAPSCQRAVTEAAAVLRQAGHTVVPFALPQADKVIPMFAATLGADGGFDSMMTSLEGERPQPLYASVIFPARLPSWLLHGIGCILGLAGQHRALAIQRATGEKTVAEYWRLLAEREAWREGVLAKWRESELDALICPGFGVPATAHNTHDKLLPPGLYTVAFSVLGYAAGVVPITLTKADECGYHDSHRDVFSEAIAAALKGSEGLPVGCQVVTLPFEEEHCLRVMAEIEAGVGFRGKFKPKYDGVPAEEEEKAAAGERACM